MNIQIEHGTVADLEVLTQLYDDINTALEQGVNYPGWTKGDYPTRLEAQEGIDSNSLFVARIDRQIVGSVILNHDHAEVYNEVDWQYDGDYSNILVIHTLAVHPKFTKRGVGRSLLEFADSLGRQHQSKAIRLDVYDNNLPAMKLYESCGYQYRATVDLGLRSYGLEWFKLYEKLL